MEKPEYPSYRSLHVVFCDDVRQEAGNKLSLMGIYQASLSVPSLPTKLPKLCAVLTATTPVSQPFKRLKYELTKNEQVVVSTEVPTEMLEHLTANVKEQADADADPSGVWVTEVGVVMQLTPFEVNEPFRLRSRIETESEVIRGQALTVGRGG